MYQGFNLSSDLADRLTQLEEDLGVPIRVMRGAIQTGFVGDAVSWTTTHSDNPRADDIGITVFDWSARSSGHGRYNGDLQLPPELFTDGSNRYDPSGDYIQVDAYEATEPIEVGGTVMGELEARNVYLFHSFHSMQNSANYPVDWTFLTDAIQRCVEPDLVASMEERRLTVVREGVKDYYANLGDGLLDDVRDRVTTTEQQLLTHQSRLTRTRQQLEGLQREATALAEQAKLSPEDRLVELDRLLEHPRLSRVDFSDGQLQLTTLDDIVLSWPERGLERWLGAFRIELSSEGGFTVRFRNLSTARSGRDHPHVPDGFPCLGAHQQLFHQLWKEGELVALLELCIQYLETFNESDDYGRFGALWFEHEDANPYHAEEEINEDALTSLTS